jgi:hypothetical protein
VSHSQALRSEVSTEGKILCTFLAVLSYVGVPVPRMIKNEVTRRNIAEEIASIRQETNLPTGTTF